MTPITRNVLAALLCTPMLLSTALSVHAEDVEGSKDHPLLTRFAGAEIRDYQQLDYDEALMPDRPIPEESTAKALELEGKITRIAYTIDGKKSALEVYRNYQNALQASGFKTVFECKNNEQCGERFQSFVSDSGKICRTSRGDFSFGGKYNVVLAKKEAPTGDVYVFLDIMQDESKKITPVCLQVVETTPMQTDQVKVNVLDVSAMQKALNESGKVAVYGVYFDTDKAEIKTESKPALDEMGKLLRDNPKLKVYVVGHTDNQGNLASNIDLSQMRADAVVKTLVSSYQISADRLSAKSVGPLSPLTSNDTEEGRAKNRRVELVNQ
ncbi:MULTISPECIES: OmpA family protein [unclassified Serratia (in: enterobacteria)]|uniref:OmpA family protein n=1 Tax=unclassified Serratia (in: enterobacteria) TaxID=2647522 RepID=UPI0004A80687|nr:MULTISPECIES: OmpA family protein [unclassified Serratia (in: enterobacteria)]